MIMKAKFDISCSKDSCSCCVGGKCHSQSQRDYENDYDFIANCIEYENEEEFKAYCNRMDGQTSDQEEEDQEAGQISDQVELICTTNKEVRISPVFTESVNCVQLCLNRIKDNFVSISIYLSKIAKYETAIQQSGCKDIYDFCEKKFGFGRTTTKNFLAINNKFISNDCLIEEVKDYNYSQLVELSSVEYDYLEEFSPDMTIKDMRKKKKSLETDNISEIQVESEEYINTDIIIDNTASEEKEINVINSNTRIIFDDFINANGLSLYTIFGKSKNGYFLCVPDKQYHIGCELAHPSDIFYNAEIIFVSGAFEKFQTAKELAQGIANVIEKMGVEL